MVNAAGQTYDMVNTYSFSFQFSPFAALTGYPRRGIVYAARGIQGH